IARSLLITPKFLLLDEPFAGVDPIAVSDIQNIVRSLKELDIGILITDHNVRETLAICDRAYVIKDGELLTSGTAKQVANDENVRKYYLGDNFKFDSEL
ncbi:MAG: ABC transporter ATP-binding protein, partial [Campylobacter sp.]|nr:ABC transporter ATP-binding protein [Campylobacter sp.]